MPRSPSPLLRECLERANPRVRHVVEVGVPDTARVLRRPDVLTTQPDPLVSLAPALGLVPAPGGGVTLASVPATLANFPASAATSDAAIRMENTSVRHNGLAWIVDGAFPRAILSRFTASLHYGGGQFAFPPVSPLQLQIYRVTRTPGVLQNQRTGATTQFLRDEFTPILTPAVVVAPAQAGWVNTAFSVWEADVVFPLGNQAIALDNVADPKPGTAGELNRYYFEVTPVKDRTGNSYTWKTRPGAQTVAGVGQFYRGTWDRRSGDETSPWGEYVDTRTYCARLDVVGYGATATAVYQLDLGRAPSAGTTARVVFSREVPGTPSPGAAATLELSTAGASGPWTTVGHGDPIATLQQTYHARVTLTPSADGRTAPVLRAVGVETRAVVDVSSECKLTLPDRSLAVPWGAGGIGRGDLTVLRTGLRDYGDVGTRLGSRAPASRLEVDVFLAPTHPAATRADYLRLDRATVVERTPTATGEVFQLASYSAALKRTLPRKAETVNATYTVASATQTRVVVTSPLPAVNFAGTGYVMRVAKSSSSTFPAGTVVTIATAVHNGGGTGPIDALDFTNALPGVLAAGDVIEVHSGVLAAVPLVYTDADPADVWLDLLDRANVPRERVGLGSLPRGGFPPSLTDRAPLATYTTAQQATMRVTNRIADPTPVGDLLDQVSAILGGATLEVDGQIVFVSLYPLRGPDGAVTVPLPAPARRIDARDYAGLALPVNLAQRTVTCSATYGVNAAAANPTATPSRVTGWTDADALLWLNDPELESISAAAVPDAIAAWCYNSGDAGLALASALAQQTVRAGSTGLRVATWTEPALASGGRLALPGDVVAILTEQYTDVDPGSAGTAVDGGGASAPLLAGGVAGAMLVQPISGWTVLTGVLVSVSGDGRTFHALIPGLSEGVQLVGGGPGTVDGSTAPIAAPADFALAPAVLATPSGGSVQLAATYTPPASVWLDHLEYLVESRATGDPMYGPPVVVAGGRNGSDAIPADFGHDYRVTPVTVSSGGTRTAGAPVVTSAGAPPAPALTFAAPVLAATSVRWPFTVSPAFAYAEVWVQTSTADPGAARSLETVGTRLDDINRNDGRTALLVPVATAGDYVLLTAVPYNAQNARGTPVNLKAQTNAAASAPGAPSAASVTGTTATTATLSVTPSAAGALRVYQDGVAQPDVAVGTVGTAQAITLTGLTPSTSYGLTVASVNAAGVESTTRTSAGTATTTAGGALPTPTISASAYSTTVQGYYVTVTNASSYPSGTVFHVEHSPTGATFTETDPTSTTATLFRSYPEDDVIHTDYARAWATCAGYTDAARSTARTTAIPR